MQHKHNATKTANAGDYHITYKDGMYKVFDKAGRFRLGFATLPAAQTYIAARSVAPRNSPLATHPEAQPS